MPTIKLYWEGYLTLDNMDDVAQAILKLLENKTFAVATVNGNTGPMPCVRTSMKLGGRKIEIAKGGLKDWGSYIKLFTRNSNVSAEEAMYVRSLDAKSPDNTFIEIGYSTIRIKQNRFNGLECTVIALNNQ
jgi:hypothetical protein